MKTNCGRCGRTVHPGQSCSSQMPRGRTRLHASKIEFYDSVLDNYVVYLERPTDGAPIAISWLRIGYRNWSPWLDGRGLAPVEVSRVSITDVESFLRFVRRDTCGLTLDADGLVP